MMNRGRGSIQEPELDRQHDGEKAQHKDDRAGNKMKWAFAPGLRHANFHNFLRTNGSLNKCSNRAANGSRSERIHKPPSEFCAIAFSLEAALSAATSALGL